MGVTVFVVLAFAIATVVSEYYERTIADASNDIVGNAMPSVQTLSTARGDLRRLEDSLDRYAGSAGTERADLHDKITAIAQNVDASVIVLGTLPFFATEQGLYAQLAAAQAGMAENVNAFLAGPDDAARARVERSIKLVDAAIQREIAFDTTQGQRLGLEIETVHARAAAMRALWNGVSVMLAAIAVVLALRQLRRVARTQQAQLEAREQRERQLGEENAALGQFAGRVAHDILSPLNTAQLAYECVSNACAGSPNATRAIERGTNAVQRVKVLVDGLLAFSRAGGHPEPGATCNVGTLLANVIGEIEKDATEKQIVVQLGPVPEGKVACSAGVLTSLVSNLLRNAIKYMGDAQQRRIDVRVSATPTRWRFEVEDTGPGIPLEQQASVFQPYIQLQRGSAGIGLGLATVDRLARAHGGAVGLRSTPGTGSMFWFELPAAAATSAN